MCPNGGAILADKVKRRFPADDSWVTWDHPRAYEHESTVADLVQEILQRHAAGINFREHNVGSSIVTSASPADAMILRLDQISTWTCGTKASIRRSG